MLGSFIGFMSVITGIWIKDAFFSGSSILFLPLFSALSGSFLFVTVFMATDPVTAPKKQPAQWLYGLMIGSVSAVIRLFSLFPEGVSFGVLIGNTFASLLDEWFSGKSKSYGKKNKGAEV